MWQQATDLYKVHASVERDGGHGAGVIVRHLHGPVPLAAVPIQEHPEPRSDQLIQGRNLLHVHRQLEGDVAQQGGGNVASGSRVGTQPLQRPYQRRQNPQEGRRSLYRKHILDIGMQSALESRVWQSKPYP